MAIHFITGAARLQIAWSREQRITLQLLSFLQLFRASLNFLSTLYIFLLYYLFLWDASYFLGAARVLA